MPSNILDTFSDIDAARIEATVGRLSTYLIADEYAVVGGLAIRYYVENSGQEYPKRDFNDIDLIVKRRSTIKPNITEDFKIAHYHEDEDDFYWALVDPKTKLKVDIFKWPTSEPKIALAPFGSDKLPIQSAEDQLAATVFDTTKVLRQTSVHPKQFSDSELMLGIANTLVADHIFKKIYVDLIPTLDTVYEALTASKETVDKRPEMLSLIPHPRPKGNTCSDCTTSADYPLTPLNEIYAILDRNNSIYSSPRRAKRLHFE